MYPTLLYPAKHSTAHTEKLSDTALIYRYLEDFNREMYSAKIYICLFHFYAIIEAKDVQL